MIYKNRVFRIFACAHQVRVNILPENTEMAGAQGFQSQNRGIFRYPLTKTYLIFRVFIRKSPINPCVLQVNPCTTYLSIISVLSGETAPWRKAVYCCISQNLSKTDKKPREAAPWRDSYSRF
jgi:hypothetical protein